MLGLFVSLLTTAIDMHLFKPKTTASDWDVHEATVFTIQ